MQAGEAHAPRATLSFRAFRGCSVLSVMQKISPRGALLASHQLICYAELTMTQEQRRLFAEKLMDTANIAVGALVFGQILSPEGFQLPLAIGGVLTYGILAGLAYALTRPKRRRE